MNSKKQMVNGIELSVIAPRRARPGTGSWNREWKVSAPGGHAYTIRGGAKRLGGCGTGFEVTSPMSTMSELNFGSFTTLKAALEFIAAKATVAA